MKILISLLGAFLGITAGAQQIPDLPVVTINSDTVTLSAAAHKKILVVTLPAGMDNMDTVFLKRIDSIANANREITVVAAPSYEDIPPGQNDSAYASLLNSFLSAAVVVSKPVYTHVSSGPVQDGLFNWLTHVSGNGHFDTEVSSYGGMFLVNDEGELIAITDSSSRYSDKILTMMLR